MTKMHFLSTHAESAKPSSTRASSDWTTVDTGQCITISSTLTHAANVFLRYKDIRDISHYMPMFYSRFFRSLTQG